MLCLAMISMVNLCYAMLFALVSTSPVWNVPINNKRSVSLFVFQDAIYGLCRYTLQEIEAANFTKIELHPIWFWLIKSIGSNS